MNLHPPGAVPTPAAPSAPEPSAPGRVPRESMVVLGLGNDLLGDDAVGLLVVRAVRARLGHPAQPVFLETCAAGLALLDELAGYREAIVVDAVQTGRRPAGFLHRLDSSELPRLAIGVPHFLGVGETLALGRALGWVMPDRVTVFAIEVIDPYTLATRVSAPVRAALPFIVDAVLTHLETRCTAPAGPGVRRAPAWEVGPRSCPTP